MTWPHKLFTGQITEVELRLLRVFRVVADCEGLAAAESELEIGRSTISKHLSDLETRFGTRLCNRGRSGFSLTDEGKVGPVGKAIGRRKVLPAVMGLLEDRIPAGAKKLRFGVVHVGYPEIIERVSAALRARYGDVDILSGPATPIFATHVGLGAWCLAYMVED